MPDLKTDKQLLAMAIAYATIAHGAQMNKDGSLYIFHPIRLMMQAKDDDERIVAILHDTIEDTPLTLAQLEEEGFPAYIIAALDCLTKRDGEDYEDFIDRIAGNELAVKVKLLDLYDNIDVTRLPELGDWELQRTAKYHRAIKRLEAIDTSDSNQALASKLLQTNIDPSCLDLAMANIQAQREEADATQS